MIVNFVDDDLLHYRVIQNTGPPIRLKNI